MRTLTDTSPRTPTADEAVAPVEGATVVVEADTAEAALAEVERRVGEGARVVDVRRIHRGGLAGFFARELVQMHAAPPAGARDGDAGAAAPASAGPAADGAPSGDLAASAGAHESAPAAGPAEPQPMRWPSLDEAQARDDDTLLEASEPEWRDDARVNAALDRAIASASGRLGTVTSDGGRAAVASQPHTPPRTGSDPVDRLLAEADRTGDEVDFATFLRARLREAEAAETATAEAVSHETEPDAPEAAAASVGPEPVEATPEEAAPASAPGAAASGPSAAAADASSAEDGTAARGAPAAVSSAPHVPAARPAEAVETGSVGERAPAEELAGQDESPAWSVVALLRLGLPVDLVRGLDLDERDDDVVWTARLAEALRPLCRPLPGGRSALVGPRAHTLAKALEVPEIDPAERIRYRRDVALRITPGDDVRREVTDAVGDRWLHLVAGGRRWRQLLGLDPLAISWAGPAELCEAISCATELGLVLGYGRLGGRVRRAGPMDLALAVRDQVPRR